MEFCPHVSTWPSTGIAYPAPPRSRRQFRLDRRPRYGFGQARRIRRCKARSPSIVATRPATQELDEETTEEAAVSSAV